MSSTPAIAAPGTAREFDVAVVGGGLVGSAIAWGLARVGQRVAVLDEGDLALRASRGNFALIWVQSKGLGLAAYSRWTLRSADAWAGFARALHDQTGIDVAHQRPGGFHLTLGEREWTHRQALMKRLEAQPGMPALNIEMLDHSALARVLPGLGDEVSGGSYCAADGHCNALRLFRALNQGMQLLGATYRPNERVERIEPVSGEFRLHTASGRISAGKLVLAAGLGNARLGRMVGLDVPVRPQRGQIIVTERAAPFLRYPLSTIRQTDEGGLLLGDSQEEAGEARVGTPVIAVLADRAVRMFPRIGRLNVVRTWAALRVMTRDGFPIYDQSLSAPGAFVATCHSGVTLAANHALVLPPLIAGGALPAETFAPFSARRFDVPQAA
jgi:glycine/D-amino acid oxidase-like deaminating enzyme